MSSTLLTRFKIGDSASGFDPRKFQQSLLISKGYLDDSGVYNSAKIQAAYSQAEADGELENINNLTEKLKYERYIAELGSKYNYSDTTKAEADSYTSKLKAINVKLGLDKDHGVENAWQMHNLIQNERAGYLQTVSKKLDGQGMTTEEKQKFLENSMKVFTGSVTGDSSGGRLAYREMMEYEEIIPRSDMYEITRPLSIITGDFKADWQRWDETYATAAEDYMKTGNIDFVAKMARPISRDIASVDYSNYSYKPRFEDSKNDYVPNNTELSKELADLDYYFDERLAKSQDAREQDRAESARRAMLNLPDGILGRVETQTPDKIKALVDDRAARESALDSLQEADRIARNDLLQRTFEQDHVANVQAREEELQRINTDYDNLIGSRKDLNDPFYRALREKGQREILDQEKQAMRQARLSSNQFNQRGNKALEAEILQGSSLARSALERDMAIEARTGLEKLTGEAAQLRNQSLQGMENLKLGQAQQKSDLLKSQSDLLQNQVAQREAITQRKEDIMGSIRQDELNRELLNQSNKNAEVFGRISAEETGVAQGIAERTGVSQQLISESNLAEQRRHQQEQERINEISARNAGNSGGGKYLCTAHFFRGTIDQETLEKDFAYAAETISDDVRRGYCWFAGPMAKAVLIPDILHSKYLPNWVNKLNHDLAYKLTKPLVLNWAREMESQLMTGESYSFLGKVINTLGIMVSGFIGKCLRWSGQSEIINGEGWDIIMKYCEFVELQNEVHKNV